MNRCILLIALCICCAYPGDAFSAHGHYTSGVEGIRAATLPPEGLYFKQYHAWYQADRNYDNKRNRTPGRFNLDVYAMANRIIYSTPVEILGGNLVVDAIVPLQYTNIRTDGFHDKKFSVGDIMLEPFLLAWHGERWDATLGIAFYLPTGEFSTRNHASPGKGFWTAMFTAGGTVYFDEAKSWSASLLSRYEVHTEQEHTDITPGNDFHFEWGIGKNFDQIFDIGVAGYSAWQVTHDSGPNSGNGLEQVHAVGPEIGFSIPQWAMHISLRSLWEFSAKNASKGNITTLSLTKAF